MKRHISIFAFLLGAFATAVLAPSANAETATITLASRGYWEPGMTPDFRNLVEQSDVISPDSVSKSVSTGDKIRFTAVPPVKGYAVDGWYQDDDVFMDSPDLIDGTAGKLDVDWTYTGTGTTAPDVYLGIRFRYLKYNVKYDENGGSSVSDKNMILYTDSFNLAAAPTLTGCAFDGWLATPVGIRFNAGTLVEGADLCPETWHEDNSNVTMVAQWTTNAYTIAYDLDGGSSTGGPGSAKYGEVFEVPHPDKAGSQFKGWKVIEGLDPKTAKWGSEATGVNSSILSADTLCNGNGASTFFLNISAATNGKVTLQAVWAADGYTITFDNQGADSGKGGISSMKVEYNVKPRDLEDNEIPFKTGFDFQGYFETTGGQTMHWSNEGVYVKKSWPYTEGKTLFAGWNAHNYSISYTGLEDATGYPTSAAYGETFALARPAKTGYKFAGWNVTDGLASRDAKWGESADLVNNAISYSWDDIVPNDKNPTGIVYIKNLNTNDNAQVTLTANWVEVKYKATFEIAGANNNPTKEVEVAYDGALPNVTTVPKYESGEIFRGYFTEPNGQGEKYWNANGTPAKEKWTVAGDLKLYECKTGFDYYITYDANGGEGIVPQQSCNSSNDVTLASGEELHRSGFRLCGWDFNKDNPPERCLFHPSQSVSFSDLKVKADGETAALFAIWQDRHVRIAIDATGGTAYTNGVEVTSLVYVDGEEYGVLPTAEKQHYVFAGWFTQAEGGEQILEDSTVDYESVKTLYAHWTPERFFVAFDGNGATNADDMAVQEFAWDEEQALSRNLYGRTGYTFDGWATNTVTMKKVFDDCQVVSNLVGTSDATQTVFAVWHTNRYTVVFNGNGATSGSMEPQDFLYDQPQELLPNGFTRGELWSFAGWTNSAAGGPLYTNQETVVNLCAEDGGVVTLDAVWTSDVGELSEAMGCDNLKWVSMSAVGKWIPGETETEKVSCALSVPGDKYALMQTKNALTNGILRFWWKSTGGTQSVVWRFGSNYENLVLEETDGQWREVVTNLSFSGGIDTNYIQIQHQGGNFEDACYIAKMTWTPEGAHPEPGPADAVEISSAAVSDGKFTLSFKSDGRFDYNLLTNANLLIDSWGVMGTKKVGDGSILKFEPQIIEGQPQLFYRVDTIQRK